MHMSANLKCTLEKKSRERMEKQRAENKKKQKNLFLGYFKHTKFVSAQGDTSSSGSNGVSGQLGSIDNSDVSELHFESSTDTECYLSSDIESD